jgi:hypothetical protein
MTMRTLLILGPRCNVPEKDEAPRLPEGFRTQFDKKGWRH